MVFDVLKNKEDKILDCFLDLLDDLNTPLYISKLHELYNKSLNGDEKMKSLFNKACRFLGLFNENLVDRKKIKKKKIRYFRKRNMK